MGYGRLAVNSTSLGFTRCESDWSVYFRKSPSTLSISAISVDDLLTPKRNPSSPRLNSNRNLLLPAAATPNGCLVAASEDGETVDFSWSTKISTRLVSCVTVTLSKPLVHHSVSQLACATRPTTNVTRRHDPHIVPSLESVRIFQTTRARTSLSLSGNSPN